MDAQNSAQRKKNLIFNIKKSTIQFLYNFLRNSTEAPLPCFDDNLSDFNLNFQSRVYLQRVIPHSLSSLPVQITILITI